MAKIKVAHIITMLELGGAQANTLYTVSHLDPERFECHLLTGPGGLLDEEARALARLGISVEFVPSLIRPVRPWRDLAALFALWRALRKIKPDIVHTHSSKAGILGRLAGALAGARVIIHTYHGFGFNARQKPWVRRAFVLAERCVIPFTRSLIVVSEANRKLGLASGIGSPARYTLIRSGIKRPTREASPAGALSLKESLGIPPGAPLVTTVGPFKPQKNLSDAIRIADLVRKGSPACRFLLVGDGEERLRLEALREQLGLGDSVLMPGWRRDAVQILSASDVFVLTSLWEGLPRSLVEAMCLGLPVVSYATDGVTDIVRDGENGFLHPPGDIERMAERIVGLLKDPSLRARIGEAARRSIGEEFDIDRMVKAQEALYERLLQKSGRGA